MTSRASLAKRKARAKQGVPIWAPWAGLALAVAVLSVLAVGPSRVLQALGGRSGPLSLTILHTNDTWGYIYRCGA